MPLQAAFERHLPAIEKELRGLLSSIAPEYAQYYGMMQYHMGWVDALFDPSSTRSGKRIRPTLCLLACKAVGSDPQMALPAAAGIEILHNFSLVHDDVEDNSDTRRGRPTVWALWGQPQAINTGDGLFALAYQAFTKLPSRGVSPARTIEALHTFSETCMALTRGQFLDMNFEGRVDISTTDYLNMVKGKTAALIATSTYLGAFVGGADPSVAEDFWKFGHHLGLVFQIQDDILGIWGDTDVLGKSTSSDIETRKNTLPVVYGLERSEKLRQIYMQNKMTPATVAEVLQILESVKAQQAAKELARHHHNKSLEALNRAGPIGSAGDELRELAAKLLKRVS